MSQPLSKAYEAFKGPLPTSVSTQHCVREGSSMLALTWQGKGKVKVQEVPVPAITDPGDAIVTVTGTTICGSDLHLYHGDILELKSGDILGHEFCGIVDQVGPECKLKVGQVGA